jgi:DNA polymerase I-like protein with 3'-5' exonuclease and polymerase domains
VAVDTETTSLDEMRADLVGISLCVDAGKAAYIPLGHNHRRRRSVRERPRWPKGQLPLPKRSGRAEAGA